MSAALTEEVKRAASSHGFLRVGVARADELANESARLREWIAREHHGEMQYMMDTEAVRIDPRHENMLPGALSVIVLVAPYGRSAEPVGPSPGKIARYAYGRDYHNVLSKRAHKVAATLRKKGFESRVSVDSMPIWERAWAQRAGVGFIGKNCCLIVPGLGSHVFLCAIVTTAELVPDEPMKERCGSCTLCLDTCPTNAFIEARSLDARRCISYLTIELRGAIPTELRSSMGSWVFGCDACQDICPYNHGKLEPNVDPRFSPDPRWSQRSAEDILRMTPREFDEFAQGSPIRRTRREGFARNLAIALGNLKSKRHLPVLNQVAKQDESLIVREAASWAVSQIAERHS